MGTKWECDSCNTEFDERDIETKLVYMGCSVEPSEYSAHCPNCDSTEIGEISAFWCSSCGDVQVQDDHELCSECLTCRAEAIRDATNGK